MSNHESMPKGGKEEPTWDTLVDGSIPTASSSESGTGASEGGNAESIIALVPGKYEGILIKGKKIEGIPKDTRVSIYLGSKDRDSRYGEKTKKFTLYRNPESGIFVISTEIDDTEEQKAYWKKHRGVARIKGNGMNQLEMKEGDVVILGREEDDVILSISDDHSFVSRRHLSVRLKDGLYTLQDLDSANGSYVEFTVEEPKAPPLRNFKI